MPVRIWGAGGGGGKADYVLQTKNGDTVKAVGAKTIAEGKKQINITIPSGLGNATAEDVAEGVTFTSDNGILQTGTKASAMSLILPDNITNINIVTAPDTLDLTWTLPTASEVPIDHFNVYIVQQDSPPASVKEMQLNCTLEPTATSLHLDGLTAEKTYYIVITSVAADGYENASLRGMQDALTNAGLWVAVSLNKEQYAYCSKDGKKWERLGIYSTHMTDSKPALIGTKVLTPYGSKSDSEGYVRALDAFTGDYERIYYNSYIYPKQIAYSKKFKKIIMSTYDNNWSDRYYYANITDEDNISANFVAFNSGVPNAPIAIGETKAFMPYYVRDGYGFIDLEKSPTTIQYNSTNAYDEYVSTVAYGNGMFVAGGTDTYTSYIYESKLSVNVDPVIISKITESTVFGEIIYAKKINKFCALVGNTLYYLNTATMKWEKKSTITQLANSSCNISYGCGKFIVAGVKNSDDYYMTAFYSTNGKDWIAMSSFGMEQGYGAFITSLYD